MAIDGPLQVKGCAGDFDITLEMLELDHDGCKNLLAAALRVALDNHSLPDYRWCTYANGLNEAQRQ